MRVQTEDLKAFEHRFRECINHTEAKSKKWKILLATAVILIGISLFNVWRDKDDYSNLSELLMAHKELMFSFGMMIFLCMLGAIQKSRAAKIISQRCRNVLLNYNVSCDEQGKLILKRSQR